MNKKKLLALCLCVAMGATAIAGGTLAYFTDTDEKTNTFVAGNVEIVQNEKDRNGVDFVDDQALLPIVDDAKDANGYHTGGNYIDKIVTVTNTGSEEAFIRTHIAFPAALDDGPTAFDASKNILHWNGASASDTNGAANWGGDIENDWYFGTSTATDWPSADNAEETNKGWNFYQATVNDVVYNVYVATHGVAVKSGETTAPSLLGVYLDAKVDYNNDLGEYVLATDPNTAIGFDIDETEILIISEAVQADGFDSTDSNVAFYALDKAFGEIGTYCPFENGFVGLPQQ